MDTVNPSPALCRLEQIPDGGAIAVDAVLADGTDSVIVLRRGEQVRAYRNVCPHTGRRLDYAPGKFLLKNDTLICAVHGATFQRDGGLCIAGPCRGEHLRAIAVTVSAGEIHLAPDA